MASAYNSMIVRLSLLASPLALTQWPINLRRVYMHQRGVNIAQPAFVVDYPHHPCLVHTTNPSSCALQKMVIRNRALPAPIIFGLHIAQMTLAVAFPHGFWFAHNSESTCDMTFPHPFGLHTTVSKRPTWPAHTVQLMTNVACTQHSAKSKRHQPGDNVIERPHRL